MSGAIESVKAAFVQLSAGEAQAPLRAQLDLPSHKGLALVMPAYLATDDILGLKVVSVFGDNPSRGLPLIHAMVILLDAETGQPAALMDGTYLTALRTGAASGAAADLLARVDVNVVAIIGGGVQGRTQLEAVCAVRSIEEAWVFDTVAGAAGEFAAKMTDRLSIPVQVAETPAEAVCRAGIICTATPATEPVFEDADLKPGTHINAVGAFTPDMQEIPAETVVRSKIVIDHREASLVEAGDLLIPISRGLMDESRIYAELGEIAVGQKPGRTSADEITLFKSVGVAVQDVATADAVVAAARQMELGTEVAL
jgi:alanine dehydrogenase